VNAHKNKLCGQFYFSTLSFTPQMQPGIVHTSFTLLIQEKNMIIKTIATKGSFGKGNHTFSANAGEQIRDLFCDNKTRLPWRNSVIYGTPWQG
jgi:hypothetical protein